MLWFNIIYIYIYTHLFFLFLYYIIYYDFFFIICYIFARAAAGALRRLSALRAQSPCVCIDRYRIALGDPPEVVPQKMLVEEFSADVSGARSRLYKPGCVQTGWQTYSASGTGRGPTLTNGSTDAWEYDQSPYCTKILDFRGFDSSMMLILRGSREHDLSHVHREFPGKFESRNLSRDNPSRGIGRIALTPRGIILVGRPAVRRGEAGRLRALPRPGLPGPGLLPRARGAGGPGCTCTCTWTCTYTFTYT